MPQGQVIDIMIIAFLQLTVLQFWKGKMGFGSLMWWKVRCCGGRLDGIGRESERVELKGESLRKKCYLCLRY